MQIKLSKEEVKTLKALDPKTKGSRPWLNARQTAAAYWRKKEENLVQDDIRLVRNAFRKIGREKLVEMNPSARGEYRITEKGRKFLTSGETEITGIFERGLATRRGKESSKARKEPVKKASAKKKEKAKVKASPKKQTKKATKKKVTKKVRIAKLEAAAAKKKIVVKKAPKRAAKKAPAKKATIEVENKTTTTTKAISKNGNGEADGARKGPPSFKRRKAAATYNPPAGN